MRLLPEGVSVVLRNGITIGRIDELANDLVSQYCVQPSTPPGFEWRWSCAAVTENLPSSILEGSLEEPLA